MSSLQEISLRKLLDTELSDESFELLLRMLRYTIDFNQLSNETLDLIFNKFHEEKYFKYYPEFVNIFDNKWYFYEKRFRKNLSLKDDKYNLSNYNGYTIKDIINKLYINISFDSIENDFIFKGDFIFDKYNRGRDILHNIRYIIYFKNMKNKFPYCYEIMKKIDCDFILFPYQEEFNLFVKFISKYIEEDSNKEYEEFINKELEKIKFTSSDLYKNIKDISLYESLEQSSEFVNSLQYEYYRLI